MPRTVAGTAPAAPSAWMNMFLRIVKLIRDDYGVDEKQLVRTAVLETDCGLAIEQVAAVLAIIAESF
jgi:hypothetical protein